MRRTLAAAVVAFGTSASAGDVTLVEAWIPDAPNSAMTRAAYITLENTGETAIGILGVKADGFHMAHLHETKTAADGVMTMTSVDEISIAPGARLSMAPGGLHIMLMHPQAPPEGSVDLTLTLTDGTEMAIEAVIRPRDAEG